MIVNTLTLPLRAAAGFGRTLLVAGLLVGVTQPAIAQAMKPWIPELISLLLFVAALRIGPRQAFGATGDLRQTGAIVVALQLLLPLCAIAIIFTFDWSTTLTATAAVLMLAGAPISGSPNLTILVNRDPAPALRILIFATALLPVTVIPVFWLTPALGSPEAVLSAAAQLLAVILVTAGSAFILRATLMRDPQPETTKALDGLAAIVMAVVVVGLMTAIGPALRHAPSDVLYWLGVVFLLNFGVQITTHVVLRGRYPGQSPAIAIGAGNRNIALFLVALPESMTDPLLLFIGCYQIPMYLTPLLLRRFYAA